MREIFQQIRESDEFALKKSFFYTFMLGLAAHGYCFLNLFLSHDSLNDFYAANRWQKANMGRIFYSAYITLTRGRIVVPWLIGIFALCWTSLAVYLIVKMFSVRRSWMIFLIAGISITNPTVYALTATYIHDLDADLFAMLLAVAAAFLWKLSLEAETRKMSWLCLGAGGALLSITLGIYQSYLCVTITLVIFKCMEMLLEKETPAAVLKKGLLGIGMLAGSGVLYWLELKLFSCFTSVSTMDAQKYNGLGNLTELFSGNFAEKITGVYRSFVNAWKTLILTSEPQILMGAVLGLFVLSTVAAGCLLMKKLDWKRLWLLAGLGILLPFGMNLTCLLSNGVDHMLMQYAVWLTGLLAILFAGWLAKEDALSEKLKKILPLMIAVTVCLMIAENIQTANAVYVKKDLEDQTTLSYMTRVADRIEEQENYIPGETPVALVGIENIGNTKYGFERYGIITGAEKNSPITYYDTLKDYFEYILGIQVNLKNPEEVTDWQSVTEMPVFPKEGSIQMIDGILVVKLSESE